MSLVCGLHSQGWGEGYSHIKWVCTCRPRLKRRGLTKLVKLKSRVLSELIDCKTCDFRADLEKWVHSEKKGGAFRADRTEKVGAFRAKNSKM